MVIIRGGGATAELNSFDNYDLARRVATFPLPVIVGIGHERDRTVLDELACVRCKTPTAVAAYILDRLQEAYSRSVTAGQGIARYVKQALDGEHMRLAQAELAIPARVKTRTMQEKMNLQRRSSSLGRVLAQRIPQENSRLDLLASRLKGATANTRRNAEATLERLGGMLRVLSPENTLKRGYSITRVNGHAVRNVDDIREGEIVETTLCHGRLYSTVTVAQKPEEDGKEGK